MDLHAIHTAVMGMALSMPRILGALTIVPLFGRSNLGGFNRAAVAAAFTVPLLPLVFAQSATAGDPGGWILALIAKEAMLGFLIGFIVALPFWAAEALGFIIDNQRGATSASGNNPATGDEATPLAILTYQAYSILFLLLGGVELFLTLIYQSYVIWPTTAWLPQFGKDMPIYYLGLLDEMMKMSVLLAAPAMITMLLAELALACVSLFAPQLQVFFLAMPIKSGIAMFVLAIYFVTLLDFMTPSIDGLKDLLPTLHRVLV